MRFGWLVSFETGQRFDEKSPALKRGFELGGEPKRLIKMTQTQRGEGLARPAPSAPQWRPGVLR